MHRLIRLVVLLVVVISSVAIAAPALANGKPEWAVEPTLGGANNNTVFTPPGAPIVTIPNDNPAIGPDAGMNKAAAQPGDVFWVVP